MNTCLNCTSLTQNKKFCNRSCAAIYNNKKFPKRTLQPRICKMCGTDIEDSIGTSKTLCFGCKQLNKERRRSKNVHRTIVVSLDSKWCNKCECVKPRSEFYSRRNKIGNSPYCKVCTNKESTDRQKRLKLQAVEYKGGSCENCGYDSYVGALDFHHLDPTKKDFSIAGQRTKFEKIQDELDKCVLLCSNCHRETHAGLTRFSE